MRIAIALSGTDRGRSGISTFVRATLPLLARAARVTVFGARDDLDAYASALRDVEAVETWRRPAGLDALWHLLRAGPLAKRLKADVLLLPAANRRLTAFAPLPTVAVVHDLAQFHVEAKFDGLRMIYAREIVVRALRRATQLMAVSEATRADLCAVLGCQPSDVRVVSNGVDLNRFSPSRPVEGEAALRALGIEDPYVLYTARLEHPGKNHLRLLCAFAESTAARGHQLMLAGADFGAEAMVRGEIARLGLSARVRMLGFVPDATLSALVAHADAVAMVGLHEGFGLPALEALAAGRPLFAAATGALPEVAGDLAAFCDPLSVASIGAALDRALCDERLRSCAQAEGPLRAAGRSWDATARGLLDACAAAASRDMGPATLRVSA